MLDRKTLLGPGARLLALVALLGWALALALERLGGPAAIRSEYGLWAAALLVPAHAILAVSPFPSEVLAVAHGAIYGLALGTLFTWSGWMLGALLEYTLFRRIALDAGPGAGERLPAWLRRLPVGHPVFLVLARLVPFGNHFANAAAGSAGVPIWRFCWTTALALAPFSFLVASISAGVAGS
jgi:uncharacterized membrane protein YdjX (TVP38/TMEM64 family)